MHMASYIVMGLERSGACSLETIENHQFPIEMGWDGMDSGNVRGFSTVFAILIFVALFPKPFKNTDHGPHRLQSRS